MQQHLKFLKASSVVVKITAWIFLCLGFMSGASILIGLVPPMYTKAMGFAILVIYAFLFFFLYFVAKMADFLSEIIKEIKKE